jgi:hypothetical protein
MYDYSNGGIYDDSGDGGDSSLTTGILSAVTQLGTAAIVSSRSPVISQQYPYRPPTSTSSIFTGSGIAGTGSGSGMLVLFAIVAVVVAFFAFRK